MILVISNVRDVSVGYQINNIRNMSSNNKDVVQKSSEVFGWVRNENFIWEGVWIAVGFCFS